MEEQIKEEVVLDPATLRVTRGGKEIIVTLLELRLLAFFLANKGRIIPLAEIHETVWSNRNAGKFNNLVNVYIHALREKLGAELIETIRGEGFRYAA